MSIGHGAVYAAIAGYLCDSFPTSVRFSAVSLTYQLGSTLSSSGPILAAVLVTSTGSVWPVAALAVVAAAAAAWAVSRPQPR
jgi:MHS family shikimate/dehydroshikimate transporter-like MFS transporter